MKSVSKILIAIGFLAIPMLAKADNTEIVYNLDCTATYTKDGVANSTHPHGTLTAKTGTTASPRLTVPIFGPTMSPVYYANLEINFYPKAGNNNWRLWFNEENSTKALSEKQEDISLEAMNSAELSYSLGTAETLAMSCKFGKQGVSGLVKALGLLPFMNGIESTRDSIINTNDLKFDHLAVIRELGGEDTAALFGILPNQGTLQVTGVTGPAFLGNAHVGKLDQEAMNHLFLKSSKPMSQTEKDGILAKYRGAQAIYFEKYKGNLCLGPDTEARVSVSAQLDNLKTTTTFAFTAVPNANGDCVFHTLSTLTQY